MKVVLFSPALVRSSIGQGASGACREMVANGDQVAVVCTEAPRFFNEKRHDFQSPVFPWTDEERVEALIAEADACIFHIGNNYDYHLGGLRWLDAGRGLVCLHDFFLGHLFHAWAEQRPAEARQTLRYWYGTTVAEDFFRHDNSHSFIETNRRIAPMTEWICGRARAVITHSRWGCDRVLASCPGPVAVVPLVFDLPEAMRKLKLPQRETGQRLNLLTVGHMNPNKRLGSVIEAIGRNERLRQNVNYRLVGAIEPHMHDIYMGQARTLGVNLEISGEVDVAELTQAMSDAHVVSCLRHPTLEAASGSAIEAMMSGRPLIVSDAGFYSEIPSRFVRKISVENEVEELGNVLSELEADPIGTLHMAREARNWARKTFTASNYARQCHKVAREMIRANPLIDAVAKYRARQHPWAADPAAMPKPDFHRLQQIIQE